MPVASKQRLHELVERLPRTRRRTAERCLEYLCADPVGRVLMTAAEDDEPLSPEDREAINEAIRSIERGEGISHEDVRREFGL